MILAFALCVVSTPCQSLLSSGKQLLQLASQGHLKQVSSRYSHPPSPVNSCQAKMFALFDCSEWRTCCSDGVIRASRVSSYHSQVAPSPLDLSLAFFALLITVCSSRNLPLLVFGNHVWHANCIHNLSPNFPLFSLHHSCMCRTRKRLKTRSVITFLNLSLVNCGNRI